MAGEPGHVLFFYWLAFATDFSDASTLTQADVNSDSNHFALLVSVVSFTAWLLFWAVLCILKPWARKTQGIRHFSEADVAKILSTAHVAGNPTCVICLLPVQAKESCAELPCRHAFHVMCLTEWYTHKPREFLDCPTCRRPISSSP